MQNAFAPLLLTATLLGGTANAVPPWELARELVGPPAPPELLRKDETEQAAAGRRVRVLKIEGAVSEAANPWDVLGLDRTVVLGDLLRALDAEARDPEVGTILLKIRPSGLGLAQARDLAHALMRARGRGKTVVAHLVTPSLPELVAASTAARILLAPEGEVLVPGLRAEMAYYKDLLASIGVEADVEAVGRYKSAPEPLTRSDISEESRESIEALLDGAWRSLVSDLARNRRLPPAKVEALLDEGLLTAEDAWKRGLVDGLQYWTELVSALEESTGREAELAFPKAEKPPNLGSFFGLMELLTRRKEAAAGGGAKVAVLVAEGPIVMGRQEGDPFGTGPVVASEDLQDAIEEIEEDADVKAVVLRVDSPGGSALASDLLWLSLHRLGKDRPLVASLGNVAASGGYYIASAARRIVAQPTTVTGSIGVFGGKLVLGGVYEKLGVRTVVLSRGKNSGLLSTMSRFTDSERTVLRRSMKRTYDTFVNRVARGRRMSYDAVDRVAQGRVWCGADAKTRGLVDDLGGLEEAIAQAAREAGLDPETARVVAYPSPKSLLELLQVHTDGVASPSPFGGALGGAPAVARALAAGLGAPLLESVTVLPGLLARERTLAMSPFALELR